MQARTDIGLKARQTLTVSDLRGVDLTTSPFLVQPNRAIDTVNFINESGVTCKRNGWKQLFQMPADERVNGMCYYEDGDHKALLVHAGTSLYAIDAPFENEDHPHSARKIYEGAENCRSQFFYSKGRCYILCGDMVVYGKFDGEYEFRCITDCDVYIPTTTISIKSIYEEGEEETSGEENEEASGTETKTPANVARASLEQINLLTRWRKNMLVGEANDSEYQLDGVWDKKTKMTVQIEKYKGNTIQIIKLISGERLEQWADNQYPLYREEDGDEDEEKAVGAITWKKPYTNVIFWEDYESIDNSSNITVTFCADIDDRSNLVHNCRFGARFGANGLDDCLFLSGNPDHPNLIFPSYSDDFTYFPDQAIAAVGSENDPITGFSRLNDNVLAVHKNGGNDATIYYLNCENQTQYDADGNIDSMQLLCYVKAGSVGEGCVNPYTTANFAGDSIFLSPSGVYGLVYTDNIATNARYTRERSFAISAALGREDLFEACATPFQNRYYLSVGGKCYVADARYRYYRENDADTSYNYEWWVFDNVPARVFCIADQKLLFGTKDGRICVFDGAYSDRTFFDVKKGSLMVKSFSGDSDRAVTVVEKTIWEKMHVGDRFQWNESPDRELFISSLYARLNSEKGILYVMGLRDKDGITVIPLLGMEITGRVIHAEPVRAHWYSTYMDMGTNMASKTVHRMTVLAESVSRGVLKFGYDTRRSGRALPVNAMKPFSFDDISFEDFSFDSGFATSHTVKRLVRNVNYIAFRFQSEDDKPCSLHNFSVQYHINKINQGVK